MAKLMSVVLFLLVVILAAAGAVLYTSNTGQTSVALPFGYTLTATLLELLAGAFGMGVLFGWIVVWTRNLRRARKLAVRRQEEEAEPSLEQDETAAEQDVPEEPGEVAEPGPAADDEPVSDDSEE